MKQMKLLKKFLNLVFKNIKEGLEEKMRGSEFVFDSVDLLYYNLYKISLNRGESYIDSAKRSKNKRGNNKFKK